VILTLYGDPPCARALVILVVFWMQPAPKNGCEARSALSSCRVLRVFYRLHAVVNSR
jgi:hypothetical protein